MIHTAQALREVRRANIDFLLNWHRDQAAAIERVNPRLADLGPFDGDTDKRDWRHLYDGSVLDD